jgi:molybdenum cofactor biosynthesis protein B
MYALRLVSVAEHKSQSPSSVPCFVLTVSDTRTLETETSGRTIAELLEAAGHTVAGRAVVRDEPAQVQDRVRAEVARGKARANHHHGGTGIAKRDSTYEAVVSMFRNASTDSASCFACSASKKSDRRRCCHARPQE